MRIATNDQRTARALLAAVVTDGLRVARMCGELNEPERLEPRWPDVPKMTRWAGSVRSGFTSV